jgi:hypothetical protein
VGRGGAVEGSLDGVHVSGLIEIFFSPGKVFDRVRERGMFLPAMIAVALLAVISMTTILNLVGLETMTRKQLESNPRTVEQLGPEKIDQIVAASNTPTRKAMSYGAATIGSVVVLLALSGLFLGGLMLVGGKANYVQVLGAVSYAWFPYSLLITLMTTLILFITPDRDSLDIRNVVATNIGAFLDKEHTGKMMLSVANSIDLLSFGEMAFLGYGLSKVSGAPFSRALMVVIGYWLIYVLGKAALSNLF